MVAIEQTKLVGAAVKRKDAPEALMGKATYAADIDLPGMLHAAIYRSPYAHARIRAVDLSAARALPGVVAAVSGKELPDFVKPMPGRAGHEGGARNPDIKWPPTTCLAVDKARFVGEPVAVVVASSPYLAADAIDLINADYELLPAVVDAEKALEAGAPLLYEDIRDNAILRYRVWGGDIEKAFREAVHVIRETIKSARITGTPMEPRAVAAHYNEGSHLLEVWDTTQYGHFHRDMLQRVLALPGLRVRVMVPRSGGAFGGKAGSGLEEVITCLMAYLTKKPVKWVSTRSEDLLGNHHARDQVHHVEMALASDGTITGIKDRIVADMGTGYIASGISSVRATALFVPGVYRVQNYEAQVVGAATNKTPFGAHRGFGKADAAFVIERMMDIAARELHMDPADIRRRNFIRSEEFPYLSVTGSRYDSGNYQKTFDKALEIIGYHAWRREQHKARREGRWIGIGTAVVVEPTSSNRAGVGMYYSVRLQIDPSGMVWVFLSGNDDGTGHSTAIAQMVGDELGVPFDSVMTVEGDSLLCPYGSGSHSSRFAASGAPAVILAAREMRKKVLAIAAELLRVDIGSLVVEAGLIRTLGEASRSISIREISRVAHAAIDRLPAGFDPGLEVLYHYRVPNIHEGVDDQGREAHFSTHPYAADVAVVEIDSHTGEIHILKYVSVHDCGNMINPAEVSGQHLGALAHGVGGTIYEEIVYDDNGQPLTQTFKDYLVPTAVDMPRFVLDHTITVNPWNPGGFKGAGEAGSASSPPCLANAVEDALQPFGGKIRSLPLKPEFIWELVRTASGANSVQGRIG
jgi:carbon-monoxide dehydrogenase large subunit